MSFDADLLKDARGHCHKLDVSFDEWATTAHRWSDVSGVDPAVEYDNRIVGISPLTRGLGQDHLIQAGSIDLELDNADGGIDWMFDTASVANLYKLRARLYVGIYDPDLDAADIPAAISWKQLGEFVFEEFPQRDAATVRISLADDALGYLNHAAQTPTLQDWKDTADATVNPLRATMFAPLVPLDTAVPLAFGEDEVPCLDIGFPIITSNVDLVGQRAYVVCCTTDAADVTTNDVLEVWVKFAELADPSATGFYAGKSQNTVVQLPQTFAYNSQTFTLWTARKSGTVSKDGKDFRILWVSLNAQAFRFFWETYLGPLPQEDSAYPGGSGYPIGSSSDQIILSSIQTLWVRGYPFSARTLNQRKQPALYIAYDLISYYSRTTSAIIDTDSFDRVKASYAFLPASGVIGVTGADPSLSLREHLTELAQSFDFDIGMSWDGKVLFSAPLVDYDAQTQTLQTVEETRIADVMEAFPSREQRGAPCNRAYLDRVKTSEIRGFLAPRTGPFDDPAGTVSSWGVVLERSLNSSWQVVEQLIRSPWEYRPIDSQLRPVVTFAMDWEGLLLDLGDLFYFNWTRGTLSDPYTNAIFQVEAITYDPGAGGDVKPIRVTALWRNDLNTLRPYLLDDQTITRRVASSGGRTATVTDGSAEVTFSSGDLTAEGVEEGDQLILMDEFEADDSFKRNKALEIISVTDATHLKVSDPIDSLDFGTPGGTAVATWEIRRSHTTYPTSVSDPTNYPDGAAMYGRVSDGETNGTYSSDGTGGFTDGHKQYEG